jgi:predicted amidohydrolase
MANKIKISALCGSRTLKSESGAEKSFSKMTDFWRGRIGQVISDRPGYVVLPEAADRFLDMDEKQSAVYDSIREERSLDMFCGLAREYGTSLVFNIKVGRRNSSFAVDLKGDTIGRYDKVFPISTEMEQGIIPGNEAAVFPFGEIKKAGFAVCFDLNFKELREEYAKLKPDVMFFSSMYHGGLAQKIWAYETRSYFVASICGNPSAITAPNGRIIAQSTNYTPYCTAEINLDSKLIHLDFNVEKLQAMKKKYGAGVKIDDVGYLGSVLVSCETEEMSMEGLMEEFQITPLDDYLDSSRKKRKEALK